MDLLNNLALGFSVAFTLQYLLYAFRVRQVRHGRGCTLAWFFVLRIV